ncbi:DUF1656 domain-containing protein [Paracoccus sp. (in: a-proteobacteria)]|uniref:DUF1656 domain-containing protein n=1 Tax=Paracoccus sp. TaxID=267 RepID=UPI003A85FFDE
MIPREINIHGVYVPPFLIVFVMALISAWATAWLLNRFRLARHFAFPRVVFVAFVALYTIAFGTFIIRI